jgi:CheY-like chemotaxis protein
VDDEPSILHSTGLLLADLGFETITEKDPTKVVARLRAERPDVLLQDVRMPGLDLDRLMGEIRSDPDIGHIPVVLFSASMDVGDVQARVGAVGFLEKPFKPAEVTRAVTDAISMIEGGAARGVAT